MFSLRACRLTRTRLALGSVVGSATVPRAVKCFSQSARLYAVKPVLLADIGEGIVECEVIQWFVQPGARVEEFSPLCEVQSDKASVEITSRFTGTVKKLHYEAGEMAKVGKPFVDIDIEGGAPSPEPMAAVPETETTKPADASRVPDERGQGAPSASRGNMAALATPAVRHVSKELNVDITEVSGTGKDGRVLKQDIYQFVQRRKANEGQGAQAKGPGPQVSAPAPSPPAPPGQQMETPMPLSPTQQQMFKTMTRSLSIPQFLYADEVDFSHLAGLRARLNNRLAPDGVKLSYLPFIIKAVSLALRQFPILNARVDVDAGSGKPCVVMRSQHNVGVAMDTPQGLLVPVVKHADSLSIDTIAGELERLQRAAHTGRLGPGDLTGGTITVSNIGTIGGTYLSPVIVEREVAILGLGRVRAVPAFGPNDELIKKHVGNLSWSADHRVVDGATMARAAEVVRRLVEEPDAMVVQLR